MAISPNYAKIQTPAVPDVLKYIKRENVMIRLDVYTAITESMQVYLGTVQSIRNSEELKN